MRLSEEEIRESIQTAREYGVIFVNIRGNPCFYLTNENYLHKVAHETNMRWHWIVNEKALEGRTRWFGKWFKNLAETFELDTNEDEFYSKVAEKLNPYLDAYDETDL